MKWVLIFISIAALAYSTKPTQEMHEAHVFAAVVVANDLPEKALLNWDDFIFSDMSLMTVAKSVSTDKMISFGIFKKVFIVDDQWGFDKTINLDD